MLNSDCRTADHHLSYCRWGHICNFVCARFHWLCRIRWKLYYRNLWREIDNFECTTSVFVNNRWLKSNSWSLHNSLRWISGWRAKHWNAHDKLHGYNLGVLRFNGWSDCFFQLCDRVFRDVINLCWRPVYRRNYFFQLVDRYVSFNSVADTIILSLNLLDTDLESTPAIWWCGYGRVVSLGFCNRDDAFDCLA